MENLSGYTETQLLKMIIDVKTEHDRIKEIVIEHTRSMDELERIINIGIENINTLEQDYITLIEEMNSR